MPVTNAVKAYVPVLKQEPTFKLVETNGIVYTVASPVIDVGPTFEVYATHIVCVGFVMYPFALTENDEEPTLSVLLIVVFAVTFVVIVVVKRLR